MRTRTIPWRRAALAAVLATGTVAGGVAMTPPAVHAIVPAGQLSLTGPGQAVWSETVTLTATITRFDGKAYPSGVVTFSEGDSVLGTAKLGSGKATLKVTTWAVGTHEVTASYPGDSRYAATTAGPVTVDVVKAATTTSITSTKTTVAKGAKAAFQGLAVRVIPGKGSLVGEIRFVATPEGGGTTYEEVRPVNSSGYATWQPLLPEKNWSVVATYLENGNWLGSTSTAVTQKVGNPPVVVTGPDQENSTPPSGSYSVWNGELDSGAVAQTFTPSRSGAIETIALNLTTFGMDPLVPLGDLNVDIVGLDRSGAIADVLLAHATVSPPSGNPETAEVQVQFSRPALVQADVTYAIRLTAEHQDGDGVWAIASTRSRTPYARGSLYLGIFGSWYPVADEDIWFKVWVTDGGKS